MVLFHQQALKAAVGHTLMAVTILWQAAQVSAFGM